jgi:hypothetical protein
MRATVTLIALALAATAACSKPERDQTHKDLSASGEDLKGVAHQVATSPDWAKARADLRKLGHDIGAATRKGGAQAKVETGKAAADAKTSAHKLAQDTRHATHEAHRKADSSG